MLVERRLLAGLDVSSAVDALMARALLPQWALVSTLDSSQDVLDARRSFESRLGPLGGRWQAVGRCVHVSRTALEQLVAGEFFQGFDELWFSHHPIRQEPARALRITANYGLDRSEQAEDWIRTSQCVTGFGDGDGLVVVTVDPTHLAALI